MNRGSRDRYLRSEIAFHVLGHEVALKFMAHALRAVLLLKGVRRGPDDSGKLQRFRDASMPQLRYVYLDDHQLRSPWPTSLVVLYDASA